MIRKLTRDGDSTYLVIDKQILNELNITIDTPLRIMVRNRRLIVEPWTEADRDRRFREALDETIREFDKDLRRLAD